MASECLQISTTDSFLQKLPCNSKLSLTTKCDQKIYDRVKKECENDESYAASDIDVKHDMKIKQESMNDTSSGMAQENDFSIKKNKDKIFEVKMKQEVDAHSTVKQPKSALYSHRLINEENGFVIKKEEKIFEVIVKHELDVGPTILQPKSTLYSHQPLKERQSPALGPRRSSGDETEPKPPDRFPASSTLGVKVEDHHNKHNNCEESVSCPGNIVSKPAYRTDERASEKSSYQPMETQTEGQCSYCVGVLQYYKDISNTPNAKLCPNTNGEDFDCDYCGYRTNLKIDLAKSLHSRLTKKSYECQQCDYKASQLSHLQSHTRRHTGEKPYSCEYCEYSASQLCSLQRHVRRHTGEKPYKCERCEYSSSYLYSLQTHMRTHTGERPFKCVHCDYSASESSKLKRHTRMHTGEKPFKCKQCDYSTSRPNYMKTHARRHTGEKPYSCDKCEYNASQLGNLKRHMRVHTSEKACTR